jgi:hypothetical protein
VAVSISSLASEVFAVVSRRGPISYLAIHDATGITSPYLNIALGTLLGRGDICYDGCFYTEKEPGVDCAVPYQSTDAEKTVRTLILFNLFDISGTVEAISDWIGYDNPVVVGRVLGFLYAERKVAVHKMPWGDLFWFSVNAGNYPGSR